MKAVEMRAPIYAPNYCLLLRASDTSQKRLWPDCVNIPGISIAERVIVELRKVN